MNNRFFRFERINQIPERIPQFDTVGELVVLEGREIYRIIGYFGLGGWPLVERFFRLSGTGLVSPEEVCNVREITTRIVVIQETDHLPLMEGIK